MESLPEASIDAGKLLAGAALGALLMFLFDSERLRELGRQAGGMLDQFASPSTRTGAATRHQRSADQGSVEHARSSDAAPLAASAPARPSPAGRSPGRGAAMAGAGLLALAGLRAPRSALGMALGMALGLAGLAGLARSGSHARHLTIEKTIRIGAPAEQVYDLFANYDNFPRFLSNVIDVRDLGNQRSHWVVKGPGGARFTWNAVLTEHRRPQRLAWESEAGAEVEQRGAIDVEPLRDSTRVTVRLSYRPPAGKVGRALANLLGSDPGGQLDADLQRIKQLVERGELGQPRRAAAGGPAVLH